MRLEVGLFEKVQLLDTQTKPKESIHKGSGFGKKLDFLKKSNFWIPKRSQKIDP
jgi:hypothetical protein